MSSGKKMIDLLKRYKKSILTLCVAGLLLFVTYLTYQYFTVGIARIKSDLYCGDKISITVTAVPWRDVSDYSVYWLNDTQWERAAKHCREYTVKGGMYGEYRFKALLDKSKVIDKYDEYKDLLADYPDEIEVYFGFFSTNNWHIVNIYLYPELLEENGMCYLKLTQTVIYTSDKDYVSCDTRVGTFNLSQNEIADVWLGLP